MKKGLLLLIICLQFAFTNAQTTAELEDAAKQQSISQQYEDAITFSSNATIPTLNISTHEVLRICTLDMTFLQLQISIAL